MQSIGSWDAPPCFSHHSTIFHHALLRFSCGHLCIVWWREDREALVILGTNSYQFHLALIRGMYGEIGALSRCTAACV